MAIIPKNYARLESGYREKALKIYPWVCGRCSREFVYSNLRELTVHHIDHDHTNNPEDGSNWELLCLYCHDHEHSKYTEADQYGTTVIAGEDAQKDVGEAHQQHVQFAADVAGKDADGGADKDGDQHSAKADQQRDAAAVQRAGEVVAAISVTAKGMLQRGAGKLVGKIQLVGVIGTQRSQQGSDDDDS